MEISSVGAWLKLKSMGSEILDLKIDKECVDPNDIETLEELLQTAVNQAVKESQDMVSKAMSKVTGGMNPALLNYDNRELPSKIQRVMDGFSQLPGVGPKTSMRYTLIMSDWSEEKLLSFGQSLKELTELEKGQRWGFFGWRLLNILNPSRNDMKKICVVESLSDCLAIERAQHLEEHILGEF